MNGAQPSFIYCYGHFCGVGCYLSVHIHLEYGGVSKYFGWFDEFLILLYGYPVVFSHYIHNSSKWILTKKKHGGGFQSSDIKLEVLYPSYPLTLHFRIVFTITINLETLVVSNTTNKN